jgi:ECF sigma factor
VPFLRASVDQTEARKVLAPSTIANRLAGPCTYFDPRSSWSAPQLFEVIELRQFAGLRHEEVAAGLGVSAYLARQKWTYARAWLGDVVGG